MLADLFTTSGSVFASGDPFLSPSGRTSSQCPVSDCPLGWVTVPGIRIKARAASSSEFEMTEEAGSSGFFDDNGDFWDGVGAGSLPVMFAASALSVLLVVVGLEIPARSEVGVGEVMRLLSPGEALLLSLLSMGLEEIAAAAVLANISIISFDKSCGWLFGAWTGGSTDVGGLMRSMIPLTDDGAGKRPRAGLVVSIRGERKPAVAALLSPLIKPTAAFRMASRTTVLLASFADGEGTESAGSFPSISAFA
mmetsp:Transcript_6679/g.16425  ORF Transcript_6679/g.16425 Transcript_6679/m.16425 type:complete len:251 (+) Transcript_6679:469-1221(+)